MQESEYNRTIPTEAHTPESIEFMGMDLPSVEIDYQTYVVMKPVVESFGLAWSDQSCKLKSSKRFRSCIKCVVTNGGPQKMVCIPLTQFDCWLMSVNPEKAHPENRDRLIAEQERLLNAKRETEMQEQKNHKEVTAETHTPEAIEFMGKKLLGVKVDDEVYVAMKPVVEGMGLVWSSQLQKLNKFRHEYNHVDIDMVAQDGKKRSMTCIPLTKLNGWLFSINKNKVHPDLREKVIAYQDECFLALYNYFNKGAAINQDMLTAEKKDEIVDAVKKAAPAQVEEDVREIALMKDEHVEEMLMEATRKEGTSDQVKEALKEIADTVNYSQFPVRTDCDYFRFDEKTMFQLVFQALQNLDDPLSPESINAFKISYCAAARCMLPRMAQGIIHHMQIEGVLEKGC